MRVRGSWNKARLCTATGALFLAVIGSGHNCQAQGPRLGRARIIITVNRQRVPADGQAHAQIRVELRDAQGNHLPDGTEVVMDITPPARLGESRTDKRPSLTVRTSRGFAIAFATSDAPGTAKITCRMQASSNFVYVEFVPEGEIISAEARIIDIRGGWVGYSMDRNIVEARDEAMVSYGGMTVAGGDILQLDIDQMILKAEPAVVKRGDEQLSGEDLYFDLRIKRGALRRFGETGEGEPEIVFFDMYNLVPREFDWELPYDAFRPTRFESDTWLVANSISVHVGEKIVLRHAKMYVGAQKAMSLLPYWIIPLPGYTGAASTRVLDLTSDGGLAVNFPYFYRVTDRATGAVEIQRGARAGSVIARRGWSLGLREEYRSGDVQGTVTIGGLPHSDWGLEWRDSRTVFGSGLADFSIGWPDHHNVFMDANVYQYRGSYRFNLRGFYDGLRSVSDSYGLECDWLTSPRPLSSDRRDTFRLGTSLGVRHNGETSGLTLRNELYGAVNPHAWRLGRRTWLTPSVSNVYAWDTADFSANSARGGLRWQHDFSDSAYMDLDYSAEYAAGDAYRDGWRQIVSTDLRVFSPRWHAYLNGSWDLTDSDVYGFLQFDYDLNDRWQVGLRGTYYKFDDTKFDDIELLAGRRVWQGQVIGLRYSQDTGKFSIELGGLGTTF